MEVVALELIRHLQQIDMENEYVIFVKEDEDAACLKSTKNFKIHTTPPYSYPFWEQVHLPRIAREAGIDLLHCTGNTAPVFYRAPMMLTLHDIIYLEKLSFGGTPYQNFGNLYRKLIVPAVVKHGRKIITVSAFEKERILERLPLPEDRVTVVYNAINKDFRVIQEADRLAALTAQYHLPGQFILFFGNTAPKKNTAGVLAAYADYCQNHTNPLPLVIADSSDVYIDRMLDKLHRKEIRHNIRVLDHIPPGELPYLYNLATLFLYPSLRESFGMPILEAMACGTPVITSATASMPEVAGEAALLINPEKPRDIAEAISRLLSDTSLCEQMINRGLKRATQFSWENTARQVLQLYQQIVV